jgi:NAD(P)-dependent dehydrogenase (short-subunit alcohol dehydrogenase family)
LDLGLRKLVIAVRDEVKGEKARTELLSGRDVKNLSIEVWKLDMLDYESITTFVERVKGLDGLDIAVLNAGVMKQTFDTTSITGHEDTIQVNFLSTALLAILLLPILKAKSKPNEPGRLVWVTSETSFWAKFPEQNSTPLLPAFDKPKGYDIFDRYGTSKLLGQLFVVELAKRVPASKVVITMPTPGWCRGTGLGEIPGFHVGQFIFAGIKRILGRTVAVGARAIVDGAVRGSEAHGQLLQECEVVP